MHAIAIERAVIVYRLFARTTGWQPYGERLGNPAPPTGIYVPCKANVERTLYTHGGPYAQRRAIGTGSDK